MSETIEIKVLSDLAEPMRQYLLGKYHPHCAIIVTADNVKVVEVQKSVPLSDEGRTGI